MYVAIALFAYGLTGDIGRRVVIGSEIALTCFGDAKIIPRRLREPGCRIRPACLCCRSKHVAANKQTRDPAL